MYQSTETINVIEFNLLGTSYFQRLRILRDLTSLVPIVNYLPRNDAKPAKRELEAFTPGSYTLFIQSGSVKVLNVERLAESHNDIRYGTINLGGDGVRSIHQPVDLLIKITYCTPRCSSLSTTPTKPSTNPRPTTHHLPLTTHLQNQNMTPNPRLVFAKRPGPHESPKAGEHLVFDNSRSIDLENVPLNGGFLTKTLLLSPEPAMRERMRDPSVNSYTTTFTVGGPILGFAVVVVLRSEKEGFKVGDYLYGLTVWEAYTVQPYVEGRVNFKPEEWGPGTFDMDSLALQVVPNPNGNYPLSKYTSVMGTPGLTAFVGSEGIIKGKEGETIFVSSGASAVGSVVIQLAKLKGMKVIASAGSDAKVEYMRSLGADLPFNYKKENYTEFLKKNGPINACWDNVGGEALDAALGSMAAYGRIAVCGTSGTDVLPVEEHYRLKNAYLIMKRCITVRGFIVPDLIPEFIGKFFEQVPALMATGKIQSQETEIEGIENAGQAIVDTLASGHEKAGTIVVVVARE